RVEVLMQVDDAHRTGSPQACGLEKRTVSEISQERPVPSGGRAARLVVQRLRKRRPAWPWMQVIRSRYKGAEKVLQREPQTARGPGERVGSTTAPKPNGDALLWQLRYRSTRCRDCASR